MEPRIVASEFVIKRGPNYHEAFGVSSRYDQQRGQFIAPHPSSDLKEALRNCAQDGEIPWDIDTCTWDDVFDEMQAAEQEYHRRGEGNRNIPRKSLRWAGDNAADVSPWFDVLPSEFGGSILTSGLKIMFSIAKQQADLRNTILTAFRSILGIITDARLSRDQFRSNTVLRDHALELYQAVLCTMRDLILLLNNNQSGFRNASRRVFRPAQRANEVDAALEGMNSKASAYQKCLHHVLNGTIGRIDATTLLTLNETRVTRAVMTDTKIDLRHIKDRVGSISNAAEDIRTRMKQMEDQHQRAEDKRDLGLSAQNALLVTLVQDLKAQISSAPVLHVYAPDGGRSVSFLPGEALAQALDVPHLAPLGDLDYLLREGGAFSNAPQTQIQAQQLLHLPRFRTWLSSVKPDMLLVHGNFNTCSRITPLSYLCAHLSLSLSNTREYIVLHFFCGQHDSRRDPLRGPQGLLRSFITQLFYTAGPFNHDFISTRDFSMGIESHDVKDLCVTFRELVGQLPLNQRVFCFIENIMWFEDRDLMQDLEDLLHILDRLTHDEYLKSIFKVLITSGTARCQIENGIPPQDQVHLIPGSDRVYHPISERTVMGDLRAPSPSHKLPAIHAAQNLSDESEEEEYFVL
ncbi:hypothetical protein BJY01DRAFT_254640 [Aspergillus pseudoustus]|uniref:Nephrocystin 3-like N-terminal domain-containing protein n=1 Tax=Aspergillus pseudoustus TaxID=1810923 RepID=A0ABR4IRP0_9EURO